MTSHRNTNPLSADGVDALLAELVQSHYGTWYAKANEILHDHHFAEDIIYEALGALALELAAGTVVDSPKNWMFITIRNLSLNKARDLKSYSAILSGLSEHAQDRESLEDVLLRDAEGTVDVTEMREQVKSLLPRMPEQQRKVINLRLFEYLSHKEVAKSLGIAESTVRSIQSQAVITLGRLLEAQGDYSDSGE